MFDGCAVKPGPTLTIVGIKDSETLHLEDGTVVRLVGALAPRRPLRAFAKLPVASEKTGTTSALEQSPWPLAEEANAALAALVVGRSATLWTDTISNSQNQKFRLDGTGSRIPLPQFPRDRYGRVLAQVTIAPTAQSDQPTQRQIWLQAALVRAGLARVYSATDARACVPQLLKHEVTARTRHKPLWRHASYAVRKATRPDVLNAYMHSFQVVEGRVRKVARYRNTTYLNFGMHWRTDFTLVVEGKALRFLKARGLNVHDLEGHRVRVRGWVETRDGPMMRLTHAEQLERLDPHAAPATLYESGALAAFDRLRSGRLGRERSPGAGTADIEPTPRRSKAKRKTGHSGMTRRKQKTSPPRARRARTNATRPKPPEDPLMLSM